MAAAAAAGGPAQEIKEIKETTRVRLVDAIRRGARQGRRGNLVLGPVSGEWDVVGTIPTLLRTFNHTVKLVEAEPLNWTGWCHELLIQFKRVLTTLRAVEGDVPCTEGHDCRLIDGARVIRRAGQTPREAFVNCGGIHVVRAALDALYNSHEAAHAAESRTARAASDLREGSDKTLTLMELGVEILREITGGSDAISDDVSADPHLPWLLLWLTDKRGYRPVVAAMLEEILRCSPVVYDLKGVDFLQSLVGKMTNADLTRFCRVLAAVVFDRDEASECTAALEAIKAIFLSGGEGPITTKPPSVLERNQDVLNSVPHLTARLVELLEPNEAGSLNLMRSPEFITMMVHMIQNPHHGADGGGGAGADAAALASVTLQELATQIFYPDGQAAAGGSGINARQISQSYYKTEVLFVLHQLVTGAGKDDLKYELIAAGLTGTLRRVLDQIDWETVGPAIPLHGPDCNCVPESGLKVQFLRFVRIFFTRSAPDSDRVSTKRYLHSKAELDELADIAREHGIEPDPQLDAIDRQYCAPGPQGIVSRIAKLFSVTVDNEDLLAYLANSLEGYLRGAPEEDRLFLYRRGVLHRTVSLLSKKAKGDKTDVLEQGLFDLLGELIRFSPSMLDHLHNILHELHKSEDEPGDVSLAIRRSLVSSNVFLRSLQLTLGPHPKAPGRPEDIANLITRKDHKMQLLLQMLVAVNVDDLHHESLCCVTTSVCFFIFADRAGELPGLLEQIAACKPKAADAPCASGGTFQLKHFGGQILDNVYSLLRLWKAYYTSECRDKDRISLEANSRISCAKWMEMADILMAPADADGVDPQRTLAFWQTKAERAPTVEEQF
mmetsp:Transcript_3241/g.9894  ORF Transcript_3241/g.9894 Transcript_3241/m.9894 type:complete len:837 (-) Transcript_3241:14-2524(-)